MRRFLFRVGGGLVYILGRWAVLLDVVLGGSGRECNIGYRRDINSPFSDLIRFLNRHLDPRRKGCRVKVRKGLLRLRSATLAIWISCEK